MTLAISLVPSQINRGSWYGTVVDPEKPKEKVLWVSDICRKKRDAKAQATNKLKELSKES